MNRCYLGTYADGKITVGTVGWDLRTSTLVVMCFTYASKLGSQHLM